MLNRKFAPVKRSGVAIRFVIYNPPNCCQIFCPICSCCCKKKPKYEFYQVVVPEDATVGKFLKEAAKACGRDQCTVAYLDSANLQYDDLIGPTIRSYECYRFPILTIDFIWTEAVEKEKSADDIVAAGGAIVGCMACCAVCACLSQVIGN